MFSKPKIDAAIRQVLAAFDRSSEEPNGTATLGARLGTWAERVDAWNQRIDLTAARSVEELVDLLVADAAALARALQGSGSLSCVDVGSGAGAPGLGLALLLPELRVTLVEPKNKRVAFLRSTLAVLGRNDVRVERARTEELPSKGWDIAVSRATLEPALWREEGARLANKEVWVLLAQQELAGAVGFEEVQRLDYRWPLTDVERHVRVYRKPADFTR